MDSRAVPAGIQSGSAPSNKNDTLRPMEPLRRKSTNNTTLSSPRPALSSPRLSHGAQQRIASSPVLDRAQTPLRRSPSVISMDDRRSSSPALSKRPSVSSLKNGDISPTTPRKLTPRRSSSSLNSASGTAMPPKSPLGATMEELPPLTAASVASDYFRRELEAHEREDAEASTVVIVHDSCYGHRFSRPKTTKSNLNLIVERPERIHACVLGMSAAYVRLGERHQGGRAPPHPRRNPDTRLPFRIRKTTRSVGLTSSVVTNVHGPRWMEELKGMCESAEAKLAKNGKELIRSEEANGAGAAKSKPQFHEGDLYLAPGSLDALQGALGGVCDAVDVVLGSGPGQKYNNAFVCIRPPGHHCSADWPSGFCWINNVHVGIEYAAQNYGLTHAAIIDFDLHHGDGSQTITWAHNDMILNQPKPTAKSKKALPVPHIGYFSLHDINSYPCENGEIDKVQAASLCIENAHEQTVWNVHLQPWKTEADFWKLYETRYTVLLEKARAFLELHTERLRTAASGPKPKAAVFISAGFDASEWEMQSMQRHKVNVPTEFYARFTRDIIKMASEPNTGAEGHVISVLEGGYSDRALTSGVFSHLSGLCGEETPVKLELHEDGGLAYEMGKKLGMLNHEDTASAPSLGHKRRYSTGWWSSSNLTHLETMVNPAPPPQPRKPKINTQPTYYSPTQSFSAKVVDMSKLYRSPSGGYGSASPSRAPSPPPPEVDWATATHELCKLLIPTDRQTRSFRPEELAEPRGKKEKAAAPVPPPVQPATRMQLRGRGAKVPAYTESPSDDETQSLRSVSRASRRQTIADLPSVTDSTNAGHDVPLPPIRKVSRRMSEISTVSSVNGDRRPSGTSRVPSHSRRTSTASTVVSAAPSTIQVVKKPRASATAKTEASKARETTKPLPAPRLPSQDVTAQRKPTELTTAATALKDDLDMDALTSSIKKITLKVPSKEEYDARRKAKAEAEAAKKPTSRTTTRKPAAPRPSKTAEELKKPLAKATRVVGKKVDKAVHASGATVEPAAPASTAPVEASEQSNGDIAMSTITPETIPLEPQAPTLDSLPSAAPPYDPPQDQMLDTTMQTNATTLPSVSETNLQQQSDPFITQHPQAVAYNGPYPQSSVPSGPLSQQQLVEPALSNPPQPSGYLPYRPPPSQAPPPPLPPTAQRPTSPPIRAEDVPQFSSHGFIPFAKPVVQHEQASQPQLVDHNKRAPFTGAAPVVRPPLEGRNGLSSSMVPQGEDSDEMDAEFDPVNTE